MSLSSMANIVLQFKADKFREVYKKFEMLVSTVFRMA
jgi:hypothetical protein